jgi:hypothetical protein
MPRAHARYVRLDTDALHRLARLCRGTRQPLERLLSAIIRDYLDSVASGGSRKAHAGLIARR